MNQNFDIFINKWIQETMQLYYISQHYTLYWAHASFEFIVTCASFCLWTASQFHIDIIRESKYQGMHKTLTSRTKKSPISCLDLILAPPIRAYPNNWHLSTLPTAQHLYKSTNNQQLGTLPHFLINPILSYSCFSCSSSFGLNLANIFSNYNMELWSKLFGWRDIKTCPFQGSDKMFFSNLHMSRTEKRNCRSQYRLTTENRPCLCAAYRQTYYYQKTIISRGI